MSPEPLQLCLEEGCRRRRGHAGGHDRRPSEAWQFFAEKDKRKLTKAGFATPRGGARGGYQNHVVRSSQVIVPYERLGDIDLSLYRDGYVVRLLPEQYFASAGTPRPEFVGPQATVQVGQNAFVLYRTHDAVRQLPPLAGWEVRSLLRNGQPTADRRGEVQDAGHYVLRLSRIGEDLRRHEGPPQGIFATEYADEDTNYLSKCALAWLIIQTSGSPYTLSQAPHLRAILEHEGLATSTDYEYRGALRHGLTGCPLCLRFIKYSELHETISFAGEGALENAAVQVEGATRSTIVNLFHLSPLLYHQLTHIPHNIAWGHAICNTRLGQRQCYSLAELQQLDRKVAIIREEGVETFGWISGDWQMIRSPQGAVWIQVNGDVAEGPPESEIVLDEALTAPDPEPEDDSNLRE
jgi:hypothetical protein